MAGLVTLIILILGTTLGPFIYTTEINGIDFSRAIQGPSPEHPFGTDDLGRDMLARVLWGGRVSIAVGITAVLLAISLGTAVGAFAGYFGRLDNPLMRVTDLFLYDLETKNVRQLTNDKYADLQPAFSPDGRQVVFTTDRGTGGNLNELRLTGMRLATIDLTTGQIHPLPLFDGDNAGDEQ